MSVVAQGFDVGAGGQPDPTASCAHRTGVLRPVHRSDGPARYRPFQCPTLFLNTCHCTLDLDAKVLDVGSTTQKLRRERASTGWLGSVSTLHRPPWRARSVSRPVGLARRTDGSVGWVRLLGSGKGLKKNPSLHGPSATGGKQSGQKSVGLYIERFSKERKSAVKRSVATRL